MATSTNDGKLDSVTLTSSYDDHFIDIRFPEPSSGIIVFANVETACKMKIEFLPFDEDLTWLCQETKEDSSGNITYYERTLTTGKQMFQVSFSKSFKGVGRVSFKGSDLLSIRLNVLYG